MWWGTQAGFLIWLGIAVVGLGAAIQVMGIWFDVLRYAGALYLAWLAFKLFCSNGDLAVAIDRARPKGSFLLQGFIVIISNPKMLVLFGAMIPPFITPDGNAMQQILLLGASFMIIAFCGDTAYALMAGRAGAWLSRSRIRALEIPQRLLPAGQRHLDGFAWTLKLARAAGGTCQPGKSVLLLSGW